MLASFSALACDARLSAAALEGRTCSDSQVSSAAKAAPIAQQAKNCVLTATQSCVKSARKEAKQSKKQKANQKAKREEKRAQKTRKRLFVALCFAFACVLHWRSRFANQRKNNANSQSNNK